MRETRIDLGLCLNDLSQVDGSHRRAALNHFCALAQKTALPTIVMSVAARQQRHLQAAHTTHHLVAEAIDTSSHALKNVCSGTGQQQESNSCLTQKIVSSLQPTTGAGTR